jgi:hypothetical protein
LHYCRLGVLLCSQAAQTVWGEVGNIAQLVEHSTENAGVVGSIPTVATKKAPGIVPGAFLCFRGTVWGTIVENATPDVNLCLSSYHLM